MDTLDKQISFAHFLLLELRRQQSVFPEGVETSNALFVYSELRLCVSTVVPRAACRSKHLIQTLGQVMIHTPYTQSINPGQNAGGYSEKV